MSVDSVAPFVVGLALGALVMAVLAAAVARRIRLTGRVQLEQYEETIVELRHERTEGREVNRRLRHELAVSTPEHLEQTQDELRAARDRIEALERRLSDTTDELSARDRSLREARLAIQEIRLQLEHGSVSVSGPPDDGSAAGPPDDIVLVGDGSPAVDQ